MADQTQASKDAAAKTRIITHMNNDHQDSLIRYLQHHAHLSSFSARNAHLSDLTFSYLAIVTFSQTPYIIPIEPPITSWSEIRPRVVAMDAEATAALNKSNVTVKRYKNPRGFMAVVFVAVLITYVLFARRAHFKPGSVFYDMLLGYVPRFANFCWKVQPLVIGPMVVLHGAEMVYMQRSRLERHTVRVGSLVWWKWMGSAFVEGFGSFVRFDEVVREEEERKAGAKH